MSPGLQAKLLHVLQERRFTRLGGNEEIEVDVRVVSATHRPLLDMVKENDFREDLYFRLNVVNIAIPPLRERRDEIPKLVRHFLQMYGAIYGRLGAGAHGRAGERLRRLFLPGQRSRAREHDQTLGGPRERGIDPGRDPPAYRAGRRRRRSALRDLLDSMEEQAGEIPLREVSRRVSLEAERETISRALDRTDWNRRKAAAMLGVSYKTLLHKIRDCDLEAPGRRRFFHPLIGGLSLGRALGTRASYELDSGASPSVGLARSAGPGRGRPRGARAPAAPATHARGGIGRRDGQLGPCSECAQRSSRRERCSPERRRDPREIVERERDDQQRDPAQRSAPAQAEAGRHCEDQRSRRARRRSPCRPRARPNPHRNRRAGSRRAPARARTG